MPSPKFVASPLQTFTPIHRCVCAAAVSIRLAAQKPFQIFSDAEKLIGGLSSMNFFNLQRRAEFNQRLEIE